MSAFPYNPSNGSVHAIGSNSWTYDSTYGVWNKTTGGGATGATGAAGVDGAGSIVTTGNKGFRYIPYDCTITDAVLIGDTTGTADFSIWRSTDISLAGSTIGGISLNNGQTAQGIVGFTTGLSENDVLEFKIQGSPASVTRASLFIEIEKS